MGIWRLPIEEIGTMSLRSNTLFERLVIGLVRNTSLRGRNRLAAALYPPSRSAKRYMQGVMRRGDGLLMHLDSRNHIDWVTIFRGGFEPELTSLLQRWLGPGSVFVDVGANIGCHVLTAGSAVGETGIVLAFEPNPSVRDVLEGNIRLNGFDGRTRVHGCALGRSASRQVLRVPRADTPEGANMGLASLVALKSDFDAVEVAVEPFDSVFDATGLSRCDVVKIDVQGYESEVLAGMTSVLSRFRPKVIFEWEAWAWAQAGADFPTVIQFFSGMGYAVFKLDPTGGEVPVVASSALPRHQDLIAVHREDLAG